MRDIAMILTKILHLAYLLHDVVCVGISHH